MPFGALLDFVFAKKEERKNRIDQNPDHNVIRRKSIHQIATEAVEEEKFVKSQRRSSTNFFGSGEAIINAIKSITNKKKVDDGPSLDEIILFITKNDTLWKRFQAEVRKNKIVTWVGTKEILAVFLVENMDVLKEEYKLAKEKEEEEYLNDKPLSKPMEFVGKLIRSLSLTDIPEQTGFKVEEESYNERLKEKQNDKSSIRRSLSCENLDGAIHLNEKNTLLDMIAKDEISFFSYYASLSVAKKESEDSFSSLSSLSVAKKGSEEDLLKTEEELFKPDYSNYKSDEPVRKQDRASSA